MGITNRKVFLFDLNGTMIDDMDYHIRAWHSIFNSLGKNISLEETKLECYGKNAEVIERVMPGRFTITEKNSMSVNKEKQYQQEFRPYLKLIDGLDSLLEQSMEQGIKMAIGSAAIQFNIDFVLDGLQLHKYFDAVVSADDVEYSKPNPETFLKCAERLGATAEDCIVFEDAPKGVEAAQRAGMQSVVITTMHPQEDFAAYDNVICFIDNYKNLSVEKLVKEL